MKCVYVLRAWEDGAKRVYGTELGNSDRNSEAKGLEFGQIHLLIHQRETNYGNSTLYI